jgi:hypothetical protein
MFLPSDGLVANIVPVLSTSIYASGDVMGAPIEVENVAQNTKGLAYLRSLVVLDAANQKAAMDILLFDRDPGNIGADNAALSLTTAQLDYIIGVVSVAAADFSTLKAATNAVALKQPNLLIPTAVKSKSIWAVFVSRGSPTYASVSDLTVKAVMERL